MELSFDNTYANLPERFYSPVEPEPVSDPETVVVNEPLAHRLGFEPGWLDSPRGAEFVTGNRILEGSEPIALVYAGHQFGNWVRRLGDGRAVLLGEVVDDQGQRFDIQLKGSGRTPYSRRGDGRAPLGPVLREYLVSESMAAMGVPTTRALAAASTGETVMRDQRLPGAVLARVARSHIRVGTFQYFASRDDAEAIELLVDYTLDRHMPQLEGGSAFHLFDEVASRQSELVARWQLLGFVHGVMNTDNMLLCGETIDYGPCAFMNEYDPDTVLSSIDRLGRYAYGNQPAIAQWNLAHFARALATAKDSDAEEKQFLERAQEVVDDVPQRFRDHYRRGMAEKLGLMQFRDGDWSLIEALLELMATASADYTLTFRSLVAIAEGKQETSELLSLPEAFDDWVDRWKDRLDDQPRSIDDSGEAMAAVNPVFIPRNFRVEQVLDDAVDDGDYEPFYELLDVVSKPFCYRDKYADYMRPPRPGQEVKTTFCGT